MTDLADNGPTSKCKTWKMTDRIRVVHRNPNTEFKKNKQYRHVYVYNELTKQCNVAER